MTYNLSVFLLLFDITHNSPIETKLEEKKEMNIDLYELTKAKYKREGYDVMHVAVAERHSKKCFKGDILVLYRSKKAPYSVKSTIAGNIYD